MSKPLQQLSGDAQRRLEEFSAEFDQAFEAADPTSEWAYLFGNVVVKDGVIRSTFPMNVSAAGYVERKGDDKLRSMYQRSISVEPIEWTDGIAEKAIVLESDSFSGWAGEPARMAREALRHPNLLVATLLEANANLDFYKDRTNNSDLGIPLFATTHPVNIFDTAFGTFKNALVQADTSTATTLNSAVMRAVFKNMATRPGANGRTMRLRPTHLFCSPNQEEACKDFLESDLDRAVFLEGGVGSQKNTQLTTNNRWKDIVQLVVGDELTTASDSFLYFLDIRSGAKPWVIQTGGSPREIVYDYNDALYKDQGMLGRKYILRMAANGALPHAIVRVNLAA